jgi:hypothetical protein
MPKPLFTIHKMVSETKAMSELFIRVYEYFKSRRWLFGLLLAGFMGIAVWLSFRLQFEEDISKIMPLDPEVGEMNKLIENSEFSDRLVVLVTFKDSTYQPENPDETHRLLRRAGRHPGKNARHYRIAPHSIPD